MIENPRFNITSAVETSSFKNHAFQGFFFKWCQINDSLKPKLISRVEWEQKLKTDEIIQSQNIVQDNSKNLFLPTDFQLQDMVSVVNAIDHDTFADKPERQNKGKEKLVRLGKVFRNSGIYISQRLDYIDHGKDIAKSLSQDFFDYGNSLITGQKPQKETPLEIISSLPLTFKETEIVDKFLAGDSLYYFRRQKTNNLLTPDNCVEDLLELQRRQTLNQFFNLSQTAFDLKRKSLNGELKTDNSHQAGWEKYRLVHNSFITRIETQINQQTETPKIELIDSVYKRGAELLQKTMPFDKLPPLIKDRLLSWENGEKTLREALNIDRMRQELDQLKKFGISSVTSFQERRMALKIQLAVSCFPYYPLNNNPSEIIATQNINCLGASILGGSLMKEVGLNYLVGGMVDHSVLFLITHDGHVQLCDMLRPKNNQDLTNNDFQKIDPSNHSTTISNILSFVKNSKEKSLSLNLTKEWFVKNGYTIGKEEKFRVVTLHQPEFGQEFQLLSNTGSLLEDFNYSQEALEVFNHLHLLDPNNPETSANLGDVHLDLNNFTDAAIYFQQSLKLGNLSRSYLGLGKSYLGLKRLDDALSTFQQYLSLSPDCANSYLKVGDSLCHFDRFQESLPYYQQAIKHDPDKIVSYVKLGNTYTVLNLFSEAINTYQRGINTDPESSDLYYFLGILYSQLNRKSEALKSLTTCAQILYKNKETEKLQSVIKTIDYIKTRRFRVDFVSY